MKGWCITFDDVNFYMCCFLKQKHFPISIADPFSYSESFSRQCLMTPSSVTINSFHYENTPMQYTAIFHGYKNDNFQLKFFDNFHIFAQNIY